ncbi:MAG: DUF2061 domain-containing protein [Candidatus Zambryskibacteria bacterium]|nr:DUF2061 domain-containing protein [Candidatus Zambryskibacteria bacterium]
MNNYSDTKTRSIVKTIIWRVIATLLTWGTIYFFTGKLSESFKMTIIAAAISMIAYYIHERIWNNIQWGKKIM